MALSAYNSFQYPVILTFNEIKKTYSYVQNIIKKEQKFLHSMIIVNYDDL